jgi:hypothetical protein
VLRARPDGRAALLPHDKQEVESLFLRAQLYSTKPRLAEDEDDEG